MGVSAPSKLALVKKAFKATTGDWSKGMEVGDEAWIDNAQIQGFICAASVPMLRLPLGRTSRRGELTTWEHVFLRLQITLKEPEGRSSVAEFWVNLNNSWIISSHTHCTGQARFEQTTSPQHIVFFPLSLERVQGVFTVSVLQMP